MKLLLLTVVSAALQAQSIQDARISVGDDPRWASPEFDDTAWPIVRNRNRDIAVESAQNRLWLRMRVEVPAGEPAAVLVFNCPCEVFLNGIRLGATGDLNSPRPVTSRAAHVFAVPRSIPPGPGLLAVRQYHPPGIEAAYPFSAMQGIHLIPLNRIGDVAEAMRDQAERPYLVRFAFLLLAIGGILAASTGARWNSTNVAMLCYLLLHAVMTVITAWASSASHQTGRALVWLFGSGVIPLLLFCLVRLARIPIRRSWAIAYLATHTILRLPWTVGLFLPEPAWWTPLSVRIFLVPSWVALGLAVLVLVKTWPHAGRTRLLLIAGILTQALNLSSRLSAAGRLSGVGVDLGWVYLNADTLANLLFIALATTHIIRTARERRAEEQRMRGELESARTVQALLLSQRLPDGVDAVYFPAGEVGGDFYQAYQTPDGALVVIGDVSGKGLQAAMRVAAIVGALRNRRSNDPAAVLGELNRMLAGSPGFTTCCCALFTPDGTIRIANAGHPPPYAAGRELDLPASLPLGLDPELVYADATLETARGLTFVSDGVPEAANPQGELFGFERTASLSRKPAKVIAEAARAWGQNDDITVVTVVGSLEGSTG